MGGTAFARPGGLHPFTGTHEWALRLPSDVNGGGGEGVQPPCVRGMQTATAGGTEAARLTDSVDGFRIRCLGLMPAP